MTYIFIDTPSQSDCHYHITGSKLVWNNYLPFIRTLINHLYVILQQSVKCCARLSDWTNYHLGKSWLLLKTWNLVSPVKMCAVRHRNKRFSMMPWWETIKISVKIKNKISSKTISFIIFLKYMRTIVKM